MNEILGAFTNWFREKTSSPLYSTFFISFILWNWKIVFTLFWQDEQILRVPKVEYVQNTLLWWNGAFLSSVLNLAWIFIPPVILTYLIITKLPRLHNWAHKLSTKNYFARKSIFDTARLEYEKQQKERLESLVKIKQEQAESEKEIHKATTDEERWTVEYDEFAKHRLSYKFKQILNTIYEHRGYIASGNYKYADIDILAFADTRGLISYKDSNSIYLTEKGKFFAKKYLETHTL